MNKLLSRYDWSNWLYGLWKAAIGGGAQAAYSAVTLIVVDPKDFNLQAGKFWAVTGAMFAYGAVKEMLRFLEKQSAPEIISEKVESTTATSVKPLAGTGNGGDLLKKTVVTETKEKIELVKSDTLPKETK